MPGLERLPPEPGARESRPAPREGPEATLPPAYSGIRGSACAASACRPPPDSVMSETQGKPVGLEVQGDRRQRPVASSNQAEKEPRERRSDEPAATGPGNCGDCLFA